MTQGETANRIAVSYEFFPTRADANPSPLEATVAAVAHTDPWVVSVTHGANASAADRTEEAVSWLVDNQNAAVMPHVVCAGQRRVELAEAIAHYAKDLGVDHFLAVRGDDRPEGKGELENATQLVDLIHSIGEFTVGVAANPEPHPLSSDRETDRRHLAAKLRKAEFAVTQFFFAPESYHQLLDDMDARGVATPIVPGLLLSTSWKSIARMSEAAGVSIPGKLETSLQKASEQDTERGNRAEVRKVIIGHATELGGKLIADGVSRLHLFTLNQADLTAEVLGNLGIGKTAN